MSTYTYFTIEIYNCEDGSMVPQNYRWFWDNDDQSKYIAIEVDARQDGDPEADWTYEHGVDNKRQLNAWIKEIREDSLEEKRIVDAELGQP